MTIIKKSEPAVYQRGIQDTFPSLEAELNEGLALYWKTAGEVLENSGINLKEPVSSYFSVERNFFSALFLYSYFRADIPASRRILYAAVNQCLRGMVTGCDNILDNEYKQTIDTDLPEQAARFRSVVDIMVSDRVLFAMLQREKELSQEKIINACNASLRALARSGVQEASEEGGTGERLKPEDVLKKVHHYKTGILFQCPWALPDVIESNLSDTVPVMKDALYHIGIGCQIFDDMVDLSRDILMDRHNYIASLIWHEGSPKDRSRMNLRPLGDENSDLIFEFPEARTKAAKTALQFLKNGSAMLFRNDHEFMIDYTIAFMAARIGAAQFLYDIDL